MEGAIVSTGVGAEGRGDLWRECRRMLPERSCDAATSVLQLQKVRGSIHASTRVAASKYHLNTGLPRL
jgi:hypothetical protein